MLGYGGDGDGDAEGRKYEETREGVGEHAVQEEAYSRTERGAEFGLDDYVELDTGPKSCHSGEWLTTLAPPVLVPLPPTSLSREPRPCLDCVLTTYNSLPVVPFSKAEISEGGLGNVVSAFAGAMSEQIELRELPEADDNPSARDDISLNCHQVRWRSDDPFGNLANDLVQLASTATAHTYHISHSYTDHCCDCQL